jgi:hypothetical protein
MVCVTEKMPSLMKEKSRESLVGTSIQVVFVNVDEWMQPSPARGIIEIKQAFHTTLLRRLSTAHHQRCSSRQSILLRSPGGVECTCVRDFLRAGET